MKIKSWLVSFGLYGGDFRVFYKEKINRTRVRLSEVSSVWTLEGTKSEISKGRGDGRNLRVVLCSLPPTEGTIPFKTYLAKIEKSKSTETNKGILITTTTKPK